MQPMRYARDAIAISRAGVTFSMRLPKRCSFVSLMRDSTPEILPITDPGTYEICLDQLVRTVVWPVLLLVVPTKDAPLFVNSPMAVVNSMIDQAIVATRPAGARNQ